MMLPIVLYSNSSDNRLSTKYIIKIMEVKNVSIIINPLKVGLIVIIIIQLPTCSPLTNTSNGE